MTELEYRKKLKDKLIKYRSFLNIPNDITFGIEIEYENVVNELITHILSEEQLCNKNLKPWINKPELDLFVFNDKDELMNGEINSPILIDTEETWIQLRKICNILDRQNAIVTCRCGGHVNIGSHIFGENVNYFRNFLLLWILYEKEIYKFCSGEFSNVRVRDEGVIDRIVPELKNNINIILKDYNDPREYLQLTHSSILDQTTDVSFHYYLSEIFKENNRFEFRVPNPTMKEEIWQNYINFFVKFLLTCKEDLDIEKLVYKIKRDEHNSIELSDLIFEEQIDKDNFLIQTLKTNKIYKKELPSHIECY